MQRYKKDKRWGVADKSFLVSLQIKVINRNGYGIECK
jgi:hypothetical protein